MTRKRIGNFQLQSQAKEWEDNDQLVIVKRNTDGNINKIDLILEPNKFDELSSKVRLSFDEFCDAINKAIMEEESTWNELRMKDQVNLVRDAIIQNTILKYAEQYLGINLKLFQGIDMNYNKRFSKSGEYVGEAIIVTLTNISMMPSQLIH